MKEPHSLNNPRTLVIGTVALVLFAILTAVVGVPTLVQVILHRSEPVQDAMTQVRANAGAKEQLGWPIETGWFVTGSFRNGKADLKVPVHGPKAEGTISVKGEGNPKGFTYSEMLLTANERTFDLRPKSIIE